MNEKYDDGLEWLRELRLKIAAECGHDIHAINEYYRAAAARVPHRSYRGESQVKRAKRKTLVHN
jgi:hypothetical protein